MCLHRADVRVGAGVEHAVVVDVEVELDLRSTVLGAATTTFDAVKVTGVPSGAVTVEPAVDVLLLAVNEPIAGPMVTATLAAGLETAVAPVAAVSVATAKKVVGPVVAVVGTV